jgi:hypothetical protein
MHFDSHWGSDFPACSVERVSHPDKDFTQAHLQLVPAAATQYFESFSVPEIHLLVVVQDHAAYLDEAPQVFKPRLEARVGFSLHALLLIVFSLRLRGVALSRNAQTKIHLLSFVQENHVTCSPNFAFALRYAQRRLHRALRQCATARNIDTVWKSEGRNRRLRSLPGSAHSAVLRSRLKCS